MSSARPLQTASHWTRKRSEDPPNGSAHLMRLATGGGGVPPTQQRALPARIQGMEGYTPTRQQDTPARSQVTEEGEGTP